MTTLDTAPIEDISKLSFEQAIAELESIVGKLESGSVSLSQSIEFYERGEALRTHCEEQLKDAEARIEKISVAANGEASGAEAAKIE